MTSEGPISETSPLSANDPLWLRLWSWTHLGASVPVAGPTPEIPYDPWPLLPSEPEEPHQELVGHEGPWTRARGGSSHSNVYHSRSQVLRVSKSPDHHHVVDIEALALSALVGEPVPSLIEKGVGWLLRSSVFGDCPTEDGPWVEEAAEFAARLRLRDLSFIPIAKYPELRALEALCGRAMIDALLRSTPYPPSPANQAPTHGDLHARNLLVGSSGHLIAVLDFESISLAPPERDIAIWLTVMVGQVGLASALRAAQVLCGAPSPEVLRAEIIRLLEFTARRTLGVSERERTTRSLVSALVEDPDLPTKILYQTEPGAH
jgi:hypothetical protein